jgi:outer membrane protein TolC
VAGDLLAPLFDAGQRAAEVDRSRALKQQRLYEYGQAVLTAFREVEDSLMQEKKQSLRIKSLTSQVRLAERTSKQLLFEYLYGLGTFIDVLTALSEEQELRRQLLSARLRRLELRIGLYRALAGSFQTVEKQPG